jgi:hypothetical protein
MPLTTHHLVVQELGTSWSAALEGASQVDQTLVLLQQDDEPSAQLEARLLRKVKKFKGRQERLASAVIACNGATDVKTLATRYRVARRVIARMGKAGAGKLLLVVEEGSQHAVASVVALAKTLMLEMRGRRLALTVRHGSHMISFLHASRDGVSFPFVA